MIDLTDFGYTQCNVQAVSPGAVLPGTLASATDTIDRPGYRYAITYTTRELPSAEEARKFEAMLERANGAIIPRPDVSYPWPMDFAVGPVAPSGSAVTINGASPTGAVVPLHGLLPYFQFKDGQPIAVLHGGQGYIHRSNGVNTADGTGSIVLPVYPLTRVAFSNGDLVEVARPRIRGILSWDGGSMQPSYGRRVYQFTITERD